MAILIGDDTDFRSVCVWSQIWIVRNIIKSAKIEKIFDGHHLVSSLLSLPEKVPVPFFCGRPFFGGVAATTLRERFIL